ncbi:unnamed protein product [Paramecium sonneborni]|uniref:Uncharacterized protein n=1 Tax=Paramecium sonneborni TaxID=65129 RepID=A0A8S1QLK7_9CILI|nr:unnamed protein product [Paramecium sonneborni]
MQEESYHPFIQDDFRFSNLQQSQEVLSQQLDDKNNQENELNNNNNSRTLSIQTQKMSYNLEDLKYKNFPKLIANNLVKWIKKKKVSKIPDGIAKLIRQRQECSQPNFKIKDLQELCFDKPSQEIFQEFTSDELFLNLIHSNKITDPFSYIPGISNYYSASQEPVKMKSNYLTRNQYVDKKSDS